MSMGKGNVDGGMPFAAEPAPSLSTDFLNQYNEVLMIIELAADDAELMETLDEWQPRSYRQHFAKHAQLRFADDALRAYEALAPERRLAFENLRLAMDDVVTSAIRALKQAGEAEERAAIAAASSSLLRRMIEAAASFIRTEGRDWRSFSHAEMQGTIDRLMAHWGRH
ncbi:MULTISPECIES: hypothetical protein [Chelatococcus]|uniref:RecG-like helicase n=1 Tax=Chelatococcus caeni TaxID=1348468 RepID=A0A840BYJ9_9HYPH|nr:MULTISPECIES: hypothetical protein [Chelatococcus]MBB4015337.1 RecG-like helicase [Chelatococcus caeni]